MNDEWNEVMVAYLTAPVTRTGLLVQEDQPFLVFNLSGENFSFPSLGT
jgi:hypothetical protein